jgi:molybdopterin-guanine dinucleotide biosynthesis protein A
VPAAIVLAGGPPDPRLAPGLPNKAFAALGGRPVVARVLAALRGCAAIERVIAVGPAAALRALDPALEVVPEQPSLMDNIAAAAAHLAGVPEVVAVPSDLPLITADAVDRFIRACAGDAGFYFAIVPQAALLQRFPGVHKTFVRVADGVFASGNILLFDPALIEKIRPFVQRVIDARKKPWLLAQLFGWSTVLKLASGTLTIAEMERRVLDVTGIAGKAVVLDAPELALDLDADRPGNVAILQAAVEDGGGR